MGPFSYSSTTRKETFKKEEGSSTCGTMSSPLSEPSSSNVVSTPPVATATLSDEKQLYQPVRGRMSEKERLKKELEMLDDDDEDDEEEASLATEGFGKAMLAKLGLKEGQALRPGAATVAYVPKVTGGFLSASTAAALKPDELKEGMYVVALIATGCGETIGIIRRCSHAIKGGRVEVQFATGETELFQFNQVRLASDTEGKLFEGTKERLLRKRQREVEEHSWIVPGLVVRIVDGPEQALGLKGAVEKIDRDNLKVSLSIDDASAPVWVPMAHVESVVPKEGQQALMVAGFKKGELVVVEGRVRAEQDSEDGTVERGSLVGVVVSFKDMGQVQVKPSHLCSLKIKKKK